MYGFKVRDAKSSAYVTDCQIAKWQIKAWFYARDKATIDSLLFHILRDDAEFLHTPRIFRLLLLQWSHRYLPKFYPLT